MANDTSDADKRLMKPEGGGPGKQDNKTLYLENNTSII